MYVTATGGRMKRRKEKKRFRLPKYEQERIDSIVDRKLAYLDKLDRAYNPPGKKAKKPEKAAPKKKFLFGRNNPKAHEKLAEVERPHVSELSKLLAYGSGSGSY